MVYRAFPSATQTPLFRSKISINRPCRMFPFDMGAYPHPTGMTTIFYVYRAVQDFHSPDRPIPCPASTEALPFISDYLQGFTVGSKCRAEFQRRHIDPIPQER